MKILIALLVVLSIGFIVGFILADLLVLWIFTLEGGTAKRFYLLRYLKIKRWLTNILSKNLNKTEIQIN